MIKGKILHECRDNLLFKVLTNQYCAKLTTQPEQCAYAKQFSGVIPQNFDIIGIGIPIGQTKCTLSIQRHTDKEIYVIHTGWLLKSLPPYVLSTTCTLYLYFNYGIYCVGT